MKREKCLHPLKCANLVCRYYDIPLEKEDPSSIDISYAPQMPGIRPVGKSKKYGLGGLDHLCLSIGDERYFLNRSEVLRAVRKKYNTDDTFVYDIRLKEKESGNDTFSIRMKSRWMSLTSMYWTAVCVIIVVLGAVFLV
jgi:hypothetical protein